MTSVSNDFSLMNDDILDSSLYPWFQVNFVIGGPYH